jgi:dipeptidase D
MKINDLYPKNLWSAFIKLCTIPRPSGLEQQAIEYITGLTKSLGLETLVDELGNIIVRKAATKGLEHLQGVILQAHIDMVGENYPVEPYLDQEGWVKAQNSALGADNGIGVAAILAILQADDMAHGHLEALFTVSEEVGLKGATALKPNLLKGSILINLDHETEGELLIGSAGATRTLAIMDINRETVFNKDLTAVEIKVSGLRGGHSGIDIHLKRGNAIKALNRLLIDIYKKFNCRITAINGGTVSNVIPSEASAILLISKQHYHSLASLIDTFKSHIPQITNIDFDTKVSITANLISETPKTAFNTANQDQLLKSLLLCPHGALTMNPKISELVESSINLAIVKTLENTVEVYTMQRSTDNFMLDETSFKAESVFHLAGGKVDHYTSYYGWEPNPKSPIMLAAQKVYQHKFNRSINLKVINAGIECSVLRANYPDLDMISIGPTITDVHSTAEAIETNSVGKFWDFLLELLKNIPAK